MIDDSIAGFAEGPVMTILASRDGALLPAIGRGLGNRRAPGGLMDTMVSAAQWPRLVANLTPGAPVAVTVVKPDDYRTYQLKGTVAALDPAEAADHDWSQAYRRQVGAVLAGLGVTPGQISFWMGDADLMRLRFRPADVFVQTPGPRAGSLLEGAP